MTTPMNTLTRSSTARRGGTSGRAARRGGGFTLIEILVVTVIIIILAGLIFIAVGAGLKTAREATERQFVRNLATGVEQFKQAFRFYPPLVDDAMPLDLATKRVRVQGDTGDGGLAALQYLQDGTLLPSNPPSEPRFSERPWGSSFRGSSRPTCPERRSTFRVGRWPPGCSIPPTGTHRTPRGRFG